MDELGGVGLAELLLLDVVQLGLISVLIDDDLTLLHDMARSEKNVTVTRRVSEAQQGQKTLSA